MSGVVAVLACIVAAQYVLIAVAVVPTLAALADERHRVLQVAQWGATLFFLGCAVTHVVIAVGALTDEPHAALSSGTMLFGHVLPHVAQIIGGAAFIVIAKRRLDIQITTKDVAGRMRELELRLGHALDASGLGAWDLDVTSGDCWHSMQHDRIFGHTEPVAAWNREVLLEHVAPADRDFVRSQFERAYRSGRLGLECRVVWPDGSEHWVAVDGTVHFDEQGHPARVLGTVSEISERKRRDTERDLLEQQLQQARKLEAVGQLAGGVAHDFNNLLTVINGYAELALAESDREATNRHLSTIAAAGQRGQQLTSQLLTVSRRQVVRPRLLDVNELTAESIGMLGRLIGDDIRIESHLRDDIGLVLLDPGQFSQVLLNLAVNARDAMPDGGVLTISTDAVVEPVSAVDDEPARWVVVAVSDTGDGIAPEIEARLFEPFFTTKAAGAGTGLGLSTVYGIVTQAGGRVSVDSEPGRGSTFTVRLPVAVEHPADAPPPEVSGALHGTERVLLVEDDADVRMLSRTILVGHGYDVVDVDGPDAALSLVVRPGQFDLLVTDVLMPTMNGRQLAARLTAVDPALRVLYVSAYASTAINADDIAARRYAFLQKPYTPRVLARTVRQVLEAPLSETT